MKENSLNMLDILKKMSALEASDLHISVGAPPMVRVDGNLEPLPSPKLSGADTKQLCYSLLTESQKHRFEEKRELDFSFAIKEVSRFRGNLSIDRGNVCGAFRIIPFQVKTVHELQLPQVISKIARISQGLVLITGPTGSGKSTTLAAIIDQINTEKQAHIITIEDPIEFLHQHKLSLVEQREVHSDTESFQAALRHVLRQDPDVVLIGELRDLESIEAALTIAETGHAVFATLHTNGAVQSINRIIDVFPPYQQSQVRSLLSLVLQATISQRLLPRSNLRGRVAATEIMLPNPAIRNLIREAKVHQIYSQMQTGQDRFGMQTLNQSLFQLVTQNTITVETALTHAHEFEELRTMFSQAGMLGKTSSMSRALERI